MPQAIPGLLDARRNLDAMIEASRWADRAAERGRQVARQAGDDRWARGVNTSRRSAPVSCGRRRDSSPAPNADRPRRAPDKFKRSDEYVLRG
jgi:hypothetical protein